MKKISIIIPIYNSEMYISRCIDSAVNQTYPNIEIVLVNDGSTDGTYNINSDYISKHDNIIYVYIRSHNTE